MRRTVIVLPDLLAESPEDSPLLQKLPTLLQITELGELKKVQALPEMDTPEAVWLGMKPNEGQMRQGPLTVSALGADPPERSTHFHVSLLGLVDGAAVAPPQKVAQEDLSKILEQAKRLNTRTLTFVNGEHVDHGLVWEGIGDMHTEPARNFIGQPIRSNLPEGDPEKELRRFIDDSVNLLNELELNERRLDEGLPPLNLLWPWGHGVRKPVPNLVLRRGERAHVESNSMRVEGLARLTGYRHGDRGAFGEGVNTRLAHLSERALDNDLSVLVIDAPSTLRQAGLLEELHWFIREMDDVLLKPLFDSALKSPSRLTVIAPGQTLGLAVSFQTGDANNNPYPFDERSLEERALPTEGPWTIIERGLKPTVRAAVQ